MNFIKPKNKLKTVINVEVDNSTSILLDTYSKYTGYEPGEVLDKFLLNLKSDENFLSWVEKQRFNKKIMTVLSIDNIEEDEKNETTNIKDGI